MATTKNVERLSSGRLKYRGVTFSTNKQAQETGSGQ